MLVYFPRPVRHIIQFGVRAVAEGGRGRRTVEMNCGGVPVFDWCSCKSLPLLPPYFYIAADVCMYVCRYALHMYDKRSLVLYKALIFSRSALFTYRRISTKTGSRTAGPSDRRTAARPRSASCPARKAQVLDKYLTFYYLPSWFHLCLNFCFFTPFITYMFDFLQSAY